MFHCHFAKALLEILDRILCQFAVDSTMRIIPLLALATCLLQLFQPAEAVAPLVVLGAVAASVKIAGYLQGLWKTHTKNHCWPKNIDAGFYCTYYSYLKNQII